MPFVYQTQMQKKSVTGKNKFMARIAKETADIAYRVTTKYC